MPQIVFSDLDWFFDMIEKDAFKNYGDETKEMDLKARNIKIPFVQGIDWVLGNPEYEKLRQNAREKVLREFEMVKVSQRYKKLYEEILSA